MSFIDDVGEFKEVIPELFEFILGLGDNVSEKELQAAKELVESTRKKIDKINKDIQEISLSMKKADSISNDASDAFDAVNEIFEKYSDAQFPYSIRSKLDILIGSIEKELKELSSDSIERILLGKMKAIADNIDDIWAMTTVCNRNKLFSERNTHCSYLVERLVTIKIYESIVTDELIKMLSVVGG